jgi:hypothetical protein
VDRNSFARRTLATVVGALVSAGLLTAQAAAQRNATLTGRVVADSGGVPIGNAGIRIPELERLERADRAGAFQVENLAPGTYVVIAEPAEVGTLATAVGAPSTAGGGAGIAVYVVDTRVGGLASLAEMSIPELEELRLYEPDDAERRWGGSHARRAIEVVPVGAAPR